MSKTFRRAVTAGCAALLAAAAPASADPVVAGPATPDELALLAVGPLATINSQQADQVALHRVATAGGAYRGRILFPSDTLTRPQNVMEFTVLRRSADGRFLTFTANRAPVGAQYQDAENATAVRVAADGTWTDQRLGSGFITEFNNAVGALTVDGSRTWVGTRTTKPFGTIAPGETALTQVANGGLPAQSTDLVDGSLVMTSNTGVHRLPGGLPTTLNTTTPLQLFLPATFAYDSTFVDTDGIPGADTAYVTRNGFGVSKYVLSGGTWAPRGTLSGAFRYVAARAVAGAVEVYLTAFDNTKVVKLLDTAEIGAQLTTTGATTLAYAPGRVFFGGLAFAPGTGFPADATPYPAAPPVLTAPLTGVQTHVGVTPKASIELEVTDANTTDITVTASSSNQAVLPNDRITVTGTGATRTVTFDPVSAGSAGLTFTASAEGDTVTATLPFNASGPAPDPTAHYYSGPVDLSAAIDVGDGYFLGVSDEVNTIHLFKKGVTGRPVKSWNQGFPGGETDFEGATRFGDTLVWTGSHGNNRSGAVRPERRFLAFQKITGFGATTELEWSHSYTRLWDQWKAWDAANGHGLGANKLKFDTATVPNLLPNAPFGFNVEGLTMAPGSQTTAWFGMRAPTITGADGIERALILPVTNIDKLTSNAVDAQFGAPIFLDLGGRSIRDINKNAADEYLITAGPGDTDDSLQNWALYTWDGNPAHDPKFVNELVTNATVIGAWEGIAEVPNPLVAGAKALLTADSGDTGLGKSYGQYVTIGEAVAGPSVVTGVTATAKTGAFDVSWTAAERTTRYRVSATNAAGQHAPGSPKFVTGTSTSFAGATGGTEYTVHVRAENPATRTANSTAVKVTPTQGARVATTTTLTFEGGQISGERGQKLVATISDPNAQGTVQFFQGVLVIGVPVPVVGGKATLDVSYLQSVLSLQAKYTSSNPEEFLSSESPVVPFLIDYRPRQPRVELVSITGDRVAGSQIGITIKVHGYTPTQLVPEGLRTRFRVRLNGSAAQTNLTGEPAFAEDGTATLYTTLAAGSHRVSAGLLSDGTFLPTGSDEVPVTIAPAGSPAPEVKPVKTTTVVTSVSGPGVRTTNQPLTMTARLADPTLTGTVQFFNPNLSANLGTAVPVVNGVATASVTNTTQLLFVAARFEPAADRDTNASSVSQLVPMYRVATTLPFPPAWATTTQLEVSGARVVGEPLTAKVTVAPVGGDAFADRDVNGGVELLDGDRVVGFAPALRGVATFDVGGLGAGVHALRARYLTSNAERSKGSESAAQDVAIAVQTKAEAPVGGSVPATLALTLGTPATFGAFTPGVEKEYTATTKATVLSTAGDAALSVSEPGHLANGAFSLPQPLRVELGRSTWTGPVSNEDVAITFKQSIATTDALRTGAYSKTLTFTLSTTNP
ncbi:fibronectin type III domain-containing protein [Solirubrobacter phytolaccae]|uniref:Fibronectin type III domain-containing protein n=1 Tax=Solirubrobacter phytolaccae TaxID=1404360 RepID=A0A9X3NF23_9ACTN|nr:fibronectin type III domain-containing protein [Solirubrobacter phytolaccae]MDA0183802.1 fibronectin type III domain-containing protein [Solirubrobacter phytolaccae]